MIPIIVCTVLGLAVSVGLSYDDAYDTGDTVVEGIGGAVIGAILGFMIALCVGAIVYTGTVHVKSPHVKLESLVDGSDVRGAFFLGSGVIDNVSVFTWYEQSKENSYVQRKADASDSTVHFLPDNNAQPYYVRVDAKYEDGSFFATWGLRLDPGYPIGSSYDFYVPRGTIKHDYQLDAK